MAPVRPTRQRRLLTVGLPVLLAVGVLVPVGVLWATSFLPASASVMDMGTADFGTGAAAPGHHHADGGTSVTTLVADPSRPPDVRVDLRAEAAVLTVGGRQVPGFTLNGTSPGPTIRARQGQLVEVRFTNGSVPRGATLHWHGMAVPNAMDGVAGVTQDAVLPGQSFTYRFVAGRPGTYWYHSHQVSHEQVIGGLFGALVVEPATGSPEVPDVLAVAHTYAGVRTINGATGDLRVPAEPGRSVRLRIVNTDNATLSVWSGQPVVVAAVDGSDLHGPTPVSDRLVPVPAGGRVDLLVTVPREGAARVQLSKATSVLVGPAASPAPEAPQPAQRLDLLSYGTPAATGLDPSKVDRHFDYVITQQPGFVKGRPGVWWAINGRLYPNVPMFMVREGETVGMHVENRTSEPHPMHPHGHTVLIVGRNGMASTGSPLWVDSYEVPPGETVDVVFRADNPGLWMDHCHNLEHARDGMVAHLAYEGISAPFRLGGANGNEPE